MEGLSWRNNPSFGMWMGKLLVETQEPVWLEHRIASTSMEKVMGPFRPFRPFRSAESLEGASGERVLLLGGQREPWQGFEQKCVQSI